MIVIEMLAAMAMKRTQRGHGCVYSRNNLIDCFKNNIADFQMREK